MTIRRYFSYLRDGLQLRLASRLAAPDWLVISVTCATGFSCDWTNRRGTQKKRFISVTCATGFSCDWTNRRGTQNKRFISVTCATGFSCDPGRQAVRNKNRKRV